MATFDDFRRLDIRVGRIIGVEDFPEARNPSYRLRIDFGEGIGIRKSCAQLTVNYTKEELRERLVLCVVNFPPKQIGPALSATAMGLIFMIGNTGGFLGPIVAGKLMDLTTAHWPGFLFMGLAGIIAAFCIFPVRETGPKGNRNLIV